MNRKRIVTALVVVAAAGSGYLLGRYAHWPSSAPSEAAASPSTAQQVYTCSMHPQVRLDRPGKCPICEMPLILAAAAETGSGG